MPKRFRSDLSLWDVPMFAALSKSNLDKAAALLTPITVDAGTVLMRQGTIADEFLIIADGLVSVTRTLENEDPQVLATVGAGGVLGEMSLLNHSRRCATVMTIKRSKVYAATPREFFALLEAVPSVRQSIVEASRVRLRDNNLAA